MLFSILAILLFLAGIGFLFSALLNAEERGLAAFFGVIAAPALIGAIYFQTHRIVDTQNVAVTRATFSQELDGPYQAGLVTKPFFGSVHTFPASNNYQRCEQFTPAIKGSYGVVVDLCFYYDATSIDWLKEVNATGSLDANYVMAVWRNSIVGLVAKPLKDYTPEALADNRSEVEAALFEQVKPWFDARGIPLVSLSFANWDFTSEEVAKAFDASIVSQRKIAEQAALLEAAKLSRERERYEAETAKLVATTQKESLESLGLEGQDAIQYLWIVYLSEKEQVPGTIILGNAPPLTVPAQ